MSKELIDIARYYAKSGLRVMPLHSPSARPGIACTCNKPECKAPAKHPRIKEWQIDATIDLARVEYWWDVWPDANIGIATGEASGVFVLDVDPKNGGDDSLFGLFQAHGEFSNSCVVQTGSGGYHYYFKWPGWKVSNTQSSPSYPSYLGAGLDLRGEGGYVVAAGSHHVSGGDYLWMSEPCEWPDAPEWLLEIIKTRGGQKVETNGYHPVSDDEVISEGSRHPQLLRWAAQMRHAGLSHDAILQTLRLENASRFSPPKEDKELVRIAKWIAAKPAELPVQSLVRSGIQEGDSDEVDDAGLPWIDVTSHDLSVISDQAWNAIKEKNQPPILFLFGNEMVRIASDEAGQIFLRSATPEILRYELARWAIWYKIIKDGRRSVFPPREIMLDLLAARNAPLPHLTRIVDAPVFGPDGSLLLVPGHDTASGVLYLPARDFDALPVPVAVTWDDVMSARELIENELLIDFPFASPADMHNAIALFLLPFVRDMIDGPTPCHLVDAPMPASGKGLLIQALLYAGVGKSVGVTTQPRDDDEWRKKITTVLVEGRPAVLFDNMSRVIDSGALAAAFTGDIWSDRILGRNETTQIKIRTIWTMTGNNVTFSTEIGRRFVHTRLAPQTDHPEDREGWRHPDLLEWVHQNRAQLVRAAHILIRYWIQQGRPAPACRLLGSFERWTRVIGGILHTAGYSQFLGNYKEFIQGSDTERQARSLLCANWFNWLQVQNINECSTTDLIPIAEAIDGFDLNGANERARVSSLGRWLKANEEVITSYSEEGSDGQTVTTKYKIVRKRTASGTPRIRKGSQMWGVELV